MTRIFAAVLLCAVSSIGCSSINGLHSQGGMPSHMAVSNSAPRPAIQRAGYDQPAIGLNDIDVPYGQGCGAGMCGSCAGVVDGCVSTVLDCNGGCCGTCQDACNGGGCLANCRDRARELMSRCSCGGQGQCVCCQQLRTMVGGPIAGRTDAIYNFNPGPSSAQVAYPYYTTRGPRDFFLNKPPTIGPY
ncbi:2Fe-2S iron-sulfur cluster-binding family protein [Aeoliella mucimassa]|uniref:Stigma-specific protein, Stig1 n=1 Tax=Aeoliella mucimassa TaxID=2527972 RepID=A0A518AWF5_9BACT|nr:hypothetical protein [Aeoliella mucimassa]QDU59067.1 hypothetical protein Pan181_53080 [Aeoliella mucimassa]